VFQFDHLSPVLACLALFGTTFLQEGVALAAGAVVILRHDVHPAFVGLSLALGMVTGDCTIYWLGRGARRVAWAKRMIARVDLDKAKTWLGRHLFVAVATSHLMPWILFPTFVAFGWFEVPFRRFALTSALFAAIYVPLALLTLASLGEAAWPYLGNRLWVLWLTAAVVITALFVARWWRHRAGG
jgi:membrane protein DedA with SNARE-associated domain